MMSTAEQRARKLLGSGAWVLLAAVALGFLTSIPTVEAAIDRASGTFFVRLVIAGILTVVGAAAIATWAGALWYARVTKASSTTSAMCIGRGHLQLNRLPNKRLKLAGPAFSGSVRLCTDGLVPQGGALAPAGARPAA